MGGANFDLKAWEEANRRRNGNRKQEPAPPPVPGSRPPPPPAPTPPNWGNLVGGGAPGYNDPGGMGGWYGHDTMGDLGRAGYQIYQPTQGPNIPGILGSAGRIDQGPQEQFRAGEVGLMDQLRAQAGGQGPSAAQTQLNSATDANVAQQMALQAAGRGNPAAIADAQRAGAAAQQQAAGQSAGLRAGEQAAAEQGLAGITGQGRAGDVGLATNQAQLNLNQQGSIANLEQNQNQYENSLMANQRGRLNDILAQSALGTQQANQGLVGTGINAGLGAVNTIASGLSTIAKAKGTVVDRPTPAILGEAGPEAVIPIDRHGNADMNRARDPRLQYFLDQNPEYKKPLKLGTSDGHPTERTAHDHFLGRIVQLRHDIDSLLRGAA